MKKAILVLLLTAGLTSFAGNAKAQTTTYDTTYPDYWDGYGLSGNGIAVQFNSGNFNNLNSVTWQGFLGASSLLPFYLYSDTNNTPFSSIQFIGNATSENASAPDINGQKTVVFSTDVSLTVNTEYWIYANPDLLDTGAQWTAVFNGLVPTVGTLGQYTAFYINGGTNISLTQSVDEFHLKITESTAVPEPSTYALFGLGAIGMLMALRRKKTA